jgi:tRNA A37 threonylcarbamoyladenosine synthetase subunit TsaC/SUA5/YrdC
LNWPGDEAVCVVQDDDAVTCSSASTLARISGETIEILRPGPITEAEINRIADRAE